MEHNEYQWPQQNSLRGQTWKNAFLVSLCLMNKAFIKNDVRSLISSFSVKSMLRTSLKYSSTPETPLGLWKALEKWKISVKVLNSNIPINDWWGFGCLQWLYDHGYKCTQGKVLCGFHEPPLLWSTVGIGPNTEDSLVTRWYSSCGRHGLTLALGTHVESRRPIKLDQSHPVPLRCLVSSS